mmetsp:Transcript_14228/g.41477  ORF Transcript_14228/g.41477 Transcript_14228/m.41477 type:complete len:248 (-) Transcript_14228:569-1312(-)
MQEERVACKVVLDLVPKYGHALVALRATLLVEVKRDVVQALAAATVVLIHRKLERVAQLALPAMLVDQVDGGHLLVVGPQHLHVLRERRSKGVGRRNHTGWFILDVWQLSPHNRNGPAQHQVRRNSRHVSTFLRLQLQQLLGLNIVGDIAAGVGAAPPVARASALHTAPCNERQRGRAVRTRALHLPQHQIRNLAHKAHDAWHHKPVCARVNHRPRHCKVPEKILVRAIRRELHCRRGVVGHVSNAL